MVRARLWCLPGRHACWPTITEHILLGLIHEGEGVAAKALGSLGMSLDGVRGQVQEIIGRGQQAPSGHIPYTPRAKKILDLALREASVAVHARIDRHHLPTRPAPPGQRIPRVSMPDGQASHRQCLTPPPSTPQNSNDGQHFASILGCSKNSDGTQTTRDQGAGTKTRIGTPAMYLEGAKEWAHGQIEAAGAVFGAIYFSANGSSLSGTGET